jgi:hypothetical protein
VPAVAAVDVFGQAMDRHGAFRSVLDFEAREKLPALTRRKRLSRVVHHHIEFHQTVGMVDASPLDTSRESCA